MSSVEEGKTRARASCVNKEFYQYEYDHDYLIAEDNEYEEYTCPDGFSLIECTGEANGNPNEQAVFDGNTCQVKNNEQQGSGKLIAKCIQNGELIESAAETFESGWSGNNYDAQARVSCPADYLLTECKCFSEDNHCKSAWTEGNTCLA